jgi:hypothetical protein
MHIHIAKINNILHKIKNNKLIIINNMINMINKNKKYSTKQH